MSKSPADKRTQSWGQVVGPELRQYLTELTAAIRTQHAGDDKTHQVRAAMAEIAGQEMQVATDVTCSRLLEELVSCGEEEQALALLRSLAAPGSLLKVASRCACSHLLTTQRSLPACMYISSAWDPA